MRILLFFPRGYDNTISTASVGTLAASMAPFGIASIAAVLRKAGHDVRIIDATLRFTIANREWARRITAWQPDIVGFSVITSHFFDAYNVCQLVKEIDRISGPCSAAFTRRGDASVFCATIRPSIW